MARKLIVQIVGDASSLERSFARASRETRSFGGAIGSLSVGFGQLVKGVLVVDAVQKALEGLHATIHLGIEEFTDHAKVAAQTNAVLRSTHGIANVAAKQVDALGLSLSNLSGVDDEVIQAGENLLLGFTNIRNFAGKNNDIFTQATKIMTDFAVRTGRDAPAAAIILGRALEDPASRVSSLSRAGIVFTKQQTDQLKAVEKNKGVLAAQKILLEQLKARFGGAAEAAGKTLPGALNILKDRFKDLAGGGVALVAPSLTKATVALTGFVAKLSEAQGFHGKLSVVVTGFADIGKSIEQQVARIDVRGIATSVSDKLGSIDWVSVISQTGHKIGAAFVSLLNANTAVIRSVNWNRLGQEIVRGIGLAIGAVVKLLVSIDWASVAKAAFRLLVAAFKAQAQFLIGVGEAIGHGILKGINAGLAAGGNALERLALRITLAIIEPFTHLPGFLGGGPFQRLKETLQQTLADMAKDGGAGGQAVGQSIAAGIQAGLASGAITIGPHSTPFKDKGAVPRTSSSSVTLPTLPPPPGPPQIAVKARKGITADQRNTFFDNMITRLLDREQDIPTLKGQVAKLQQISGLISARLAVTKDITRKLNLEDQIVAIRRQVKPLQQQIKDAQQFFTLGLDPTGSARVPLVNTLKKQLANVSAAVQGTFLDTNKTRSVLGNIKKVLSAGIGNVSSAVRSQIAQMLSDIDKQLRDHANGPLTKTTVLDSSRVLAGLGLSPADLKTVRARLSHFNSAGIALAGSGSGSVPTRGNGTISVRTPDVYLDGKKVTSTISAHQRKTTARNPPQRRGPNAGMAFT